jgi:polyhydroxyalkanoate synthesis regulator phasin
MTIEKILTEIVSLREAMTTGFARVDAYFELQHGQHLQLRGDVNELRGDVNELRGDVNDLLNDLRVMVGALIDRVDRIEIRMETLEQTVQRLDNEVRALRDWATREFAEVRSELRQMRHEAGNGDATLRRDVDALLARVDRLEERLGGSVASAHVTISGGSILRTEVAVVGYPEVIRQASGPRPSPHRLLQQRNDAGFFGSGQFLQCKRRRPHAAFVEVGLVAEAERRIPRLELLRGLEEADDLAVPRVRRHPIPRPRRQLRRIRLDERMQPLGHRPIRFRHRGDPCEDLAFGIRLPAARPGAAARFRLQLLRALLHGRAFVIRELACGGGLPWTHGISLPL